MISNFQFEPWYGLFVGVPITIVIFPLSLLAIADLFYFFRNVFYSIQYKERFQLIDEVMTSFHIGKFLTKKGKLVTSAFVIFVLVLVGVLLFDGWYTAEVVERHEVSCQKVLACNYDSGKEYTLPAKVTRSGNSYFVNNVYFPNGGYLYFSDGSFVPFEEYFLETDQNEKEWKITLTGEPAENENVQYYLEPVDTWHYFNFMFFHLLGSFLSLLETVFILSAAAINRKNNGLPS